MAKVAFNVSAKTARLIGRENISNLEGALTELVKNAYDADASHCIVYYENSTKSLWLIDNGSGMTQDIVKYSWMTIGNSSKTDNYMTSSGRIQTGEKGIGRFALDRIASKCNMHSISNNSNFIWSIDWDDFSSQKLITDIYAEINDTNKSLIEFSSDIRNKSVLTLVKKKFRSSGTCFLLQGLRDDWTQPTIERLKKSLSRLLPPSSKSGFRIHFFDEVSKIKESEIFSAYIDSYDYKVKFNLSGNGICEITLNRNEFDFGKNFEQIMIEADFTKEDRDFFKGTPIRLTKTLNELLPGVVNPIDLGPVSGEIYYYKLLSQEKNEEKFFYKDFSTRKNAIKEISGIKIYRDNFIVRPYGFNDASEYDWLSLSTRHATSPAGIAHPKGAWTVQSNQVSGQIYISRLNKNLPDKSSREGIVETPEFNRFKEFIIAIIQILENDRQYVIRKLDLRYKEFEEGEKALVKAKELLAIISNDKSNDESDKNNHKYSSEGASDQYKSHYESFQKAIEYQEDKIIELEEEMGLLRTLATTGIVVNTYIHEIKALTTKMNMGIKEAYELLCEDNDIQKAIEELKGLRQLRNSFNSWFKVTLDSVKRDKRTMKKHSVNDIIRNSIATWKDVQSGFVSYQFDEPDEVSIRCFPYDFESIMNNLLTNSVSIFKGISIEAPKITIELGRNEEYYYIYYHDNGPGLSNTFKNDPDRILKQGITDKRDVNDNLIGTGMGLWIIKNIISDYKGYIDVSENKITDKGFFIKLFFKGR